MASSSKTATSGGESRTAVQSTKRSSSKLDSLLEKLHSSADSSGTSDVGESRSGSSRRKPKVTRKVTKSEEVSEEEENGDDYMELNGKGTLNGDTDEEMDQVISDGTMVVKPRPVVKGHFRGPEISKSRIRKTSELEKVLCTSCNKQVNPYKSNAIRRHPVLKVLICKKCYDYYTSDEFDQDSDGMDEQCRWCGQGGNLLMCDYCSNAFCKGCIKRNLGRAAASEAEREDSKWRCYVCSPKPLKQLVEYCKDVMEVVKNEERRRKEEESVSHKGKRVASNSQKSSPHAKGSVGQADVAYIIKPDKINPVLERLSALALSVQDFTCTLSESYNSHEDKTNIQDDVSNKLQKMLAGVQKQLAGIEDFAREGSRPLVSTQVKQQCNPKEVSKSKGCEDSSSSLKNSQSSRLSLPKKNDIIELSSDDDDPSDKVIKISQGISKSSLLKMSPSSVHKSRPKVESETPSKSKDTEKAVKDNKRTEKLRDSSKSKAEREEEEHKSKPEAVRLKTETEEKTEKQKNLQAEADQVISNSTEAVKSRIEENMEVTSDKEEPAVKADKDGKESVSVNEEIEASLEDAPALDTILEKESQLQSTGVRREGQEKIKDQKDGEEQTREDALEAQKNVDNVVCTQPAVVKKKEQKKIKEQTDDETNKDDKPKKLNLQVSPGKGLKIKIGPLCSKRASLPKRSRQSSSDDSGDETISQKKSPKQRSPKAKTKKMGRLSDRDCEEMKEDLRGKKAVVLLSPLKQDLSAGSVLVGSGKESSLEERKPKKKATTHTISDSDCEQQPSPKEKHKQDRSPEQDSDSDIVEYTTEKGKGKGKGKSSSRKSLDYKEKKPGRSRKDIEAQRKLHQQMLMGDSSDDDAGSSDSESDVLDDPSDTSSSEDAASDYDPRADAKELKKEKLSRTESAKRKTKSKFEELRKKRESDQRKKKESERKQRKGKQDSSDSESEDDRRRKKSRKKTFFDKERDTISWKKKRAGSKYSDGDSENGEKIKKMKNVEKKEKAKQQSAKKGNDSSESDNEGKSKRRQEKKKKKEHGSDSSYDSELENDISKLAVLPTASRRTHKKAVESDKEILKKEKKVSGPEKCPRQSKREQAAKKKGVDIDELSGCSDSSSEIEHLPDQVMEIDEDYDKEKMMRLKAAAEKDEAHAKSRQALLALDSTSDSSLNFSNEEDDEDDDGGEKKEKKKKSEDGTSDSGDVRLKSRKKQKQTALLKAKIDSDDSDVEKTSKKKKKANNDSDNEFVLDEVDDEEAEDLETIEEEEEDDLVSIPDDDSDMEMKKKKKKKKGKKDESEEEEEDGDGKKKKGKRKRKRIKKMSDSSPETEDSDAPKPKAKKRKKKKKGSGDEEEKSEEGSGSDDPNTPGKKRKNIKKIIKDKKLSQDTKSAAKAEQERRERIKERQSLYNQVTTETETAGKKVTVTTKLVLETAKKDSEDDSDDEEKVVIEVHPEIINKLKVHQVEAVKFLWDCLVESLDRLKNEEGAGCILAHCMGLGKTLSMIAFIHTLLINEEKTKQHTCIVVCPLNTVLNWQHEFEKWQPDDATLDVYEMTTVKDNWGRADRLKSWQEGGGILIMGYEMYRNLSQLKRVRNKKHKKIFTETLVDPGPDLVVCDEGHILKNDKSSTSIAMNKVRTKRRVVLTGTPLQNNLGEYHCMVDFVKPSLLGTRKEFSNRFVNPITNGQCANASKWDVKLMKKRAHILHETLAGCVQRRDYSALTKFLPPKHEYILSVRLSKVQCELYSKYLEIVGRSGLLEKGDVRGASLFSDYQNLSRIWTHPWILKLHEVREQNKKIYDDEDSFIDDDDDDMDSFIDDSESGSEDVSRWKKKSKRSSRRGLHSEDGDGDENHDEPKAGTSSGKRGSDRDSDIEVVKKYKTRSRRERNGEESEPDPEPEKEALSREWWAEYVSEGDQHKLELSGKLMVLAEVLKMSEAIGDKVLVFSQSLLSLDLIEDFLEHWDKTVPPENPDDQVAGTQAWTYGIDYFRMDGSTNSALRKKWSEIFNDAENPRARLFLISTKAGSLGTNMVGANRCIIFDASWNPTHDVQSIFRVYRFGQVKPVYVYRFLAQGTMEEKIYERQVTKQSLSCRVVDEQQIERHFTAESLQELYNFTPDRLDDPNYKERPTPILPKDRMLAEMLTSMKDHIVTYHEHDSLLENQITEELSEEDRKAAWEEYEAEKKGLIQRVAMPNYQQPRMQMNPYQQYSQQYAPPPQNMSMFPHLTEVARAIRNANPNVSMAELQQRLEHYMRLQMASQQQVLYQQQQHMARYGMPQTQIMGGPEPGEVTFMRYGNKQPPQQEVNTGSALYSVLNGKKPD